jgi:hypothetical protein
MPRDSLHVSFRYFVTVVTVVTGIEFEDEEQESRIQNSFLASRSLIPLFPYSIIPLFHYSLIADQSPSNPPSPKA